MTCDDCERDPCICGDLFPFGRERTPEGKIYDHLGGLLFDPDNEIAIALLEAPEPRTHCRMCGTRLRNTRAQVLGECRRCHK